MTIYTDPDAGLRVLVMDDDAQWVDTLVAQFRHRSVYAEGVSDPNEMLRLTESQRLDYDIIFLDMRLGMSEAGEPITAEDILLKLMTYMPTARVVIFTQQEITVDECVRCIQWGALGFIPKTSDVEEFILVAKVYQHVGDQEKAREGRIRSLWIKLEKAPDQAKGRLLEMFMINVFDSIGAFEVISHNKMILPGEVDIVVENRGKHEFWQQLDSLHLVVECKKRDSVSEKDAFGALAERVRAKHLCNAGILVSWTGVTRGFRELQTAGKERMNVKIFSLDKTDLYMLIRRSPDEREDWLRRILSQQL